MPMKERELKGGSDMPKVSGAVLSEVQEALRQYREEVERSLLTPTSQMTYLLHADQFVRWLNDDFEPGATKT